ncbi:hypothetical protein ACFY4I_12965 [Streptomyces scabiei]
MAAETDPDRADVVVRTGVEEAAGAGPDPRYVSASAAARRVRAATVSV